jgi:nitrogen fixation protein NifU and related proteins
MSEYTDYILDLYKHPILKKRLTTPTITSNSSNASCGDTIVLDVQIDNAIISNVGWDGTGCAISQAGMSILAEELIGKTLKQAQEIDATVITNEIAIELSPRRLRCALLALEAVRNLKKVL